MRSVAPHSTPGAAIFELLCLGWSRCRFKRAADNSAKFLALLRVRKTLARVAACSPEPHPRNYTSDLLQSGSERGE